MLIIFILYVILVMIGAFHPRPPKINLPKDFGISHYLHFGQYFMMALFYYVLRRKYDTIRKYIYIEIFFIGAFVSVITEEIQRLIPGRTQSWGDVVANLLGFYSFVILSILVNKKWKKA